MHAHQIRCAYTHRQRQHIPEDTPYESTSYSMANKVCSRTHVLKWDTCKCNTWFWPCPRTAADGDGPLGRGDGSFGSDGAQSKKCCVKK